VAEIIFALDYDDLNQAREMVKELKSEIKYFKVGLQLFSRYGPKAVEMIKRENSNVFLDLKVHDIPQICSKVVSFAADAGCYSMTMHIQAGNTALEFAKKNQTKGFPHIWGVTVLSSIREGDSLLRARKAQRYGLEGVIVSGKDVSRVKKNFPRLEIVVPGIRPAKYGKKDDQKRVLTPSRAAGKGADFLVIGRPIKEAADPLKMEIKDISC
jgi:orotidine-5'-phosphate decarboxylase